MMESEPQMRDASVQVKLTSIITLQKKPVTISAETQTLNLETDDSYEATLLRGGPLPAKKPPCIIKFYINGHGRKRSESSLSARFQNLRCQNVNTDNTLDEEKSNIILFNTPDRPNIQPKTAQVAPTVGGKPIPSVVDFNSQCLDTEPNKDKVTDISENQSTNQISSKYMGGCSAATNGAVMCSSASATKCFSLNNFWKNAESTSAQSDKFVVLHGTNQTKKECKQISDKTHNSKIKFNSVGPESPKSNVVLTPSISWTPSNQELLEGNRVSVSYEHGYTLGSKHMSRMGNNSRNLIPIPASLITPQQRNLDIIKDKTVFGEISLNSNKTKNMGNKNKTQTSAETLQAKCAPNFASTFIPVKPINAHKASQDSLASSMPQLGSNGVQSRPTIKEKNSKPPDIIKQSAKLTAVTEPKTKSLVAIKQTKALSPSDEMAKSTGTIQGRTANPTLAVKLATKSNATQTKAAQPAINTAANAIQPAITTTMMTVQKATTSKTRTIPPATTSATKTVAPAITISANAVQPAVTTTVKAVQLAIATTAKAVQRAISPGIETVPPATTAITRTAPPAMNIAMKAVRPATTATTKKVPPAIPIATNTAQPAITTTTKAVHPTIATTTKAVEPAITSAMMTVQEATTSRTRTVPPATTSSTKTVTPAITISANTVQPAVTTTMKAVQPAIATTAKAVQRAITPGIETVPPATTAITRTAPPAMNIAMKAVRPATTATTKKAPPAFPIATNTAQPAITTTTKSVQPTIPTTTKAIGPAITTTTKAVQLATTVTTKAVQSSISTMAKTVQPAITITKTIPTATTTMKAVSPATTDTKKAGESSTATTAKTVQPAITTTAKTVQPPVIITTKAMPPAITTTMKAASSATTVTQKTGQSKTITTAKTVQPATSAPERTVQSGTTGVTETVRTRPAITTVKKGQPATTATGAKVELHTTSTQKKFQPTTTQTLPPAITTTSKTAQPVTTAIGKTVLPATTTTEKTVQPTTIVKQSTTNATTITVSPATSAPEKMAQLAITTVANTVQPATKAATEKMVQPDFATTTKTSQLATIAAKKVGQSKTTMKAAQPGTSAMAVNDKQEYEHKTSNLKTDVKSLPNLGMTEKSIKQAGRKNESSKAKESSLKAKDPSLKRESSLKSEPKVKVKEKATTDRVKGKKHKGATKAKPTTDEHERPAAINSETYQIPSKDSIRKRKTEDSSTSCPSKTRRNMYKAPTKTRPYCTDLPRKRKMESRSFSAGYQKEPRLTSPKSQIMMYYFDDFFARSKTVEDEDEKHVEKRHSEGETKTSDDLSIDSETSESTNQGKQIPDVSSKRKRAQNWNNITMAPPNCYHEDDMPYITNNLCGAMGYQHSRSRSKRECYIWNFAGVLMQNKLKLQYTSGDWMNMAELKDFMRSDISRNVAIVRPNGTALSIPEVVELFTLSSLRINFENSTLIRNRLGILECVWEKCRGEILDDIRKKSSSPNI